MRTNYHAPLSTFEWKKCSVIDEKEKLLSWYADNPSEYGNLWEPTIADGTKVEVHIPWMIALPLRAASLSHQFKGAGYRTASGKSRHLPRLRG